MPRSESGEIFEGVGGLARHSGDVYVSEELAWRRFADHPAFRRLLHGDLRVHALSLAMTVGFLILAMRLIYATAPEAFFEAGNVAATTTTRIAVATAAAGQEAKEAPDPKRKRPRIVDRRGRLLATDVMSGDFYVDGRKIADPDDVATRIAAILGDVDRERLRKRLATRRARISVASDVTPALHDALHRMGLPGSHFEPTPRRFYPDGALFSHILGFTGADRGGQSGIELRLDDRGGEGVVVDDGELVLSLDSGVQAAVRLELSAALDLYRAKAGGAAVMDIHNGEILAMVSLPDFDPHNDRDLESPGLFHRMSLGVYEMGSVFKLFSLAAALQDETIALDSQIDVSGPMRLGPFSVRDFSPHAGNMTPSEILLRSSNIGAARIAVDLGAARLRRRLGDLGLLAALPLEIGERAAPIEPKRWGVAGTATVSYGYGLSVTPLHVAVATARTLNGGFAVEPTLLRRRGPVRFPRILRDDVSRAMLKMVRRNVRVGTAKNAQTPFYALAAKTGTAEKATGGGYDDDAVLTSIAGVFPYPRPRYAIVTFLDEPQPLPGDRGRAVSSLNAAPLAGRLVERIAPLLGLNPEAASPPPRRPRSFAEIGGGDET